MTALPGPSPRRPRQTGLINYGLARHHLHKRVGTWLQPGGHLEPGESLGTRQRETREDSPCGTPTEARGWSTATPIPPDSTPTEPSISARLSRPRNRRSWLPRWRQRGSERFEAPAFLRGLHVGSGGAGCRALRRPLRAAGALRLPEKGLAYRPPCPCGGSANRMPCVLNRTDRLRGRLALDRTCCATNRVYRSPNRSRQQSASKTHRSLLPSRHGGSARSGWWSASTRAMGEALSDRSLSTATPNSPSAKDGNLSTCGV
jgi:hypothetical protein